MRVFDEQGLIELLKSLSKKEVSCFAIAAATRQIVGLERYFALPNVEYRQIVDVLDRLWGDIKSEQANGEFWGGALPDVMSWLPDEGEEWSVFTALAEDAVSSLAYSIRSHQNGDPQEGAWAARCAYEAADQAAIRFLGIQPGTKESERTILMHAIVQRELDRQTADIDRIKSGLFEDVRLAAISSPILQDDEVLRIRAL